MSKASYSSSNRSKRHPTRHRGIKYRLLADGSRRYLVYHDETWIPVDGGEKEAIALQGRLRQQRGGKKPSLRPKKVKDVVDAWLASKRKLAESTRREYEFSVNRYIVPEWGRRKIQDIDRHDIRELGFKIAADGLAKATYQNYLRKPGSQLFRFAQSEGLILTSPFDLLTSDDVPDFQSESEPMWEWTTEQIESVIAKVKEQDAERAARHAHTERVPIRYGPPIRSLFDTGFRLGELTGLLWNDVEFEKRKIHVRRQWTQHGELVARTKTQAGAREFPMTDELVEFLSLLQAEEVLRGFGSPDHPVFAGEDGNHLSHANFRNRGWYKALEAAGLPRINPHQARHAFVSRAVARGAKPEDLYDILGHANPGVTRDIYVHIFDRDERQERQREFLAR